MQFLAALPPPGPARDAAILAAIEAGKLDPPTWIQVPMGRVTLTVSADWLTIDGTRIPMCAHVAQVAVDALGALLPTPAIVEAIEVAARAAGRLIPFTDWPHWQGDSQLQTSTIAWREACILGRLAGGLIPVPAGAIVAGCLKDVVIAPFMRLGRVSIFGALDGTDCRHRVQPLYPDPNGQELGHGAFFDGGYAHGVRAVKNDCLLDGAPALVTDILGGHEAHLLGGPVAFRRYPTPASSASPTATSTPQTSAAAPGVLARGAEGEAVKEAQRLLCDAGFQVAVDGFYGPLTEAAVRSYQGEYGLVQDGRVGPMTLAALRGGAPPSSGAAPTPAGPVDLASVPLPLNDTERVQVFGSFEWVPAPSAAEPGAIRILGSWVRDNIVTIKVPQLVGIHGDPAGHITCHKLAAPTILRFFEAVEAAGKLPLILSFDGCWNPRLVRGGHTLSNHAWGTDFDLNAAWNPRGKPGPAAGDKGSVVELLPIAAACGLGWGGGWSTPDPMHFGARAAAPAQ